MRTLILGGVRSGKSRHAAELARRTDCVTLIATAEALDAEMTARIEAHRAGRPAHWRVVEEPIRLAAALGRAAAPGRTVIVDCLTLWLSNLLGAEEAARAETTPAAGGLLASEQAALLESLPRLPGDTVLISNEVGLGIMPANALARRFADAAGTLHQKLGAICDRVVLMTAGLPLALKCVPLLLGFLLADAGQVRAAAVTLHDDLQREVTLPDPPRRLVTMLPSLTETVCGLGACDRLVATDRFSNWPEQVRALPKAGGLDDAAVEMIVSARPDLVLLSRSQRISDRLGELGVRSFVLETRTYSDIARTVTIVGGLLGLEAEATRLNASIAESVRRIGAASRAHKSPGPTVYFEVDRGPYAAGAASFIGELLARLGARNIVTDDLGPFPRLNPEYVVRHDPDVILMAPEVPHLADRPGWDRIRAVREHRLCSFDSDTRDTIVRPGPRVAEGMRAIADCLARVEP
ncbi:MAG TPA: bifunctional adenosylcobinamide kinase/adenosylcobinamide-phosphate guanylyltransferase [Steroidobacteraceae bacterium]|jgi:iron complex transport system substrate-binding protein|nr:bifunctional adenosylcobinamide kinase/adenosylcobinamide-phosphate guanylyltransferase [Steroidobacteraceae bacterium]